MVPALFARDPGPLIAAGPARSRLGRWWVTIAMIVGGIAYAADQLVHRTQLVAQIDPNLHAAAIFVGVFGGVLASAGYARMWWRNRPYETDPRRRSWIGLVALVLAIPAFGCIGASYGARRLVEWRAFHDLPVVTAPAEFTIVGTESHKGTLYVLVRLAPGDRTIRLYASRALYGAARIGDHVTLPVQTGRGGVQRVVPEHRQLDLADRHGW